MSTPSEKDTEFLIFCDCGMLADIIPAQGDRYQRHTVCRKVFNAANKIPYTCDYYYVHTCVVICSYMCVFHVM